MHKSSFKILKMDCPSEEQLIRMKLSDLNTIQTLDFDIPNRTLIVFHTDHYSPILKRLDELRLDTTFLQSEHISMNMHTNGTENKKKERQLLWLVLIINFSLFLLEVLTGFISNSMGLVADSLDMLADSIVYGLALYAVGGSLVRKKNIAKFSGYFQLILALLGLYEVIRRVIGQETIPSFQFMIVISLISLIGNGMCLYLLQKSKSKEVHMQASMLFTSNDIIVNTGVIVAGIFVYITDSYIPDLIVGSVVFLVVARGAFKILSLSK